MKATQEALEALVHVVQPAGVGVGVGVGVGGHSQRGMSSDVLNSARPADDDGDEELLAASGKSLEGSMEDLHEVLASVSLSNSSLTDLLK